MTEATVSEFEWKATKSAGSVSLQRFRNEQRGWCPVGSFKVGELDAVIAALVALREAGQ